jgi:hypothetical protein
MANTPPDGETETGAPQNPDLDTELDRFERHHRYEREHPLFGVHPDGVGPTLGQDLGKPNPGHAVDWDNEDPDPST